LYLVLQDLVNALADGLHRLASAGIGYATAPVVIAGQAPALIAGVTQVNAQIPPTRQLGHRFQSSLVLADIRVADSRLRGARCSWRCSEADRSRMWLGATHEFLL
jgi:hypothetical protein